MDVRSTLRERIVALQRQNGWTVAAMARECGLSRGSLEKYLRGEAKPAFDSIDKICRRTGCTPNWLVYGAEMNTNALKEVLRSACVHSAHEVIQKVLDLAGSGKNGEEIAAFFRDHGTINRALDCARPWSSYAEMEMERLTKVVDATAEEN